MIAANLQSILSELPQGVRLVAVSKFHPLSKLMEAYSFGQRAFGENRPQEFAAKAVQMPADTEWHFIGHLQTNKLKLVLPYAWIVESVDTEHLLDAIEAWGERNERRTRILLEVHIGTEETKQGFTPEEIPPVLQRAADYPHVEFCGLMGMASHTDDPEAVSADFARIKALFDRCRSEFPGLCSFRELSIGMSEDWQLAIKNGSTEIRLGTAIFGPREY